MAAKTKDKSKSKKRVKKFKKGFGGFVGVLKKQGKSDESARKIAASVARKKKMAPGQKNFRRRKKG
jgi:hypothetical protein